MSSVQCGDSSGGGDQGSITLPSPVLHLPGGGESEQMGNSSSFFLIFHYFFNLFPKLQEVREGCLVD